MAEEERNGTSTPFSLSFSGSGFLALYQIGVVQSLLELAPEILKSASKVYGASAGSLIAAAVVCESSLEDLKESFHEAVRDARKTILGPLSPGCNMLRTILKGLYKMLPENSHQMASGRLHISLTRVMDGQNVMVSEFSSKEDLIQALICSCFVPIYCGFIPPSFRGVRYVDGGFTNLQPCSDLEAVITVSPFTGELDICPRDCPAIFYSFQIFNSSIQISVENLCRISYALFPPSYLVLNEFFFRGYQDAVLFLRRNNAFGINYPANSLSFWFASLLSKNDLSRANEESSYRNPDTEGLESNGPALRDLPPKQASAVNGTLNGTDQKIQSQLSPHQHKGSGFLVNYQIGVVQALWELAPEVMRSTSKVYGASCGSVIAAAVVCDVDIGLIEEFFHEAMEEARKARILTLCPGYRMLRIIEKRMRQVLPENSHQLASGKLFISLTRLLDLENVIISEYRSKEELIQAVICSCFLPVYCGFNPPSFQGMRYMDGGISNVQPRSDSETMITVSPYTGEVDICPRDCPAYFSCISFSRSTFQLSVENLCRFSYSIFPPSLSVLYEFYLQGYHDAVFFLQRHRENGTANGTEKKIPKQTPMHCDKAVALPAPKSQETPGSLGSAAEITSQHLVPCKLHMDPSLPLTDR